MRQGFRSPLVKRRFGGRNRPVRFDAACHQITLAVVVVVIIVHVKSAFNALITIVIRLRSNYDVLHACFHSTRAKN